MIIVKNILISIILIHISLSAIVQNMDACYYQIVNRGSQLYKITEDENHLNYQKMDLHFISSVYLLAFNQKKKELLAISRNCQLLKLYDIGKVYESLNLENIDVTNNL